MKNSFPFLIKRIFCLATFCKASFAMAQFTPGNLVVLQVGDAIGTLTNTGNPIILREFNTSGAATFSVNVPSTGSAAIVSSGAASSEGVLSNSADKKFLVFGGYNQALPNSSPLAASASSVIARAIGIADATGTYSLAASSAVFYSGNNLRAATSDGSNNYWASGGVDGTDYFGNASSAVNAQNIKLNTRAVAIFNNQLYFSTQSASGTQTLLGIYAVGSGASSASGQTITNVINTTTGSAPVQFYFQPSASPTVCYVADGRTSTGGGVQKWVYSASTWTLAYTIPTSTSSAGANGVVADFSGTNPMIYATTVEGTANRLVSISDIGASSTATTIATAGTNSIFRGLAFSPCSTASITSLTSNGPICANQTLSLNVAASGGSLTTFNWFGPGTFSSASSASTTVSGAATGAYTVQATNGCGSTFSVINVSVTAQPSLSINASTTSVCFGQTLTLNGGGATSYTWSNGILDGVPFTPTASSVYTVNGNTSGCQGAATIAVTVNSLALVATPITICTGQSGTLLASGANTYTWNTGSNSPSIAVSPSTTTSYTIGGTSAAGCSGSVTTQVIVTSSPVVTINTPTICSGTSATLVASGVNSYTWNTGANTNSIVVTPQTTTTYSLVGSLNGCPGLASGSVSVLVSPSPSLTISGSNSVCSGKAYTAAVSGANTYSWSNGASTASVTLTLNATSVFTVNGYNSNGCGSSLTTTITVKQSPTINIAGSATAICAGQQATLSASGASSYSWSNGGTSASVIVNPTATAVYSVVGTSTNGCIASASISQTVSTCLSVSESERVYDYVIYPNPAKGNLTIQSSVNENLTLTITDMMGAVILHTENYLSGTNIALPDLSKGVYFVKILNGNTLQLKKLIIE